MTAGAVDVDAELEHTVTELVALQAAQQTMADRESVLKVRLRELLPEHGSWTVGTTQVGVTPNRRFDADQARKLIDPAALPVVQVTTTTIDGAKCKALFPEVYDRAQKIGENRITLR